MRTLVCLRSGNGFLDRSIHPITRIAEPGHDVSFFVESFVKGSSVEGDLRVVFFDSGNAFGGSNEADHADVIGACLSEHGQGSRGAASCSEHGIDEDDGSCIEIGRELIEIGVRLEGLFVTGESKVSDACFGHDFEYAIDHAKSCAEHGDDGDGACEDGASGGCLCWCFDLDGLGGQRAGHFIDHQPGDLGESCAEGTVPGVLVADGCHFVGDQWMVEDDNAVFEIRGGVLGHARVYPNSLVCMPKAHEKTPLNSERGFGGSKQTLTINTYANAECFITGLWASSAELSEEL